MRLAGGFPMERDLAELIAELDHRIPKDAACVRFYQQGGGPDESAIQATPAGYLRLGVELLKAASAASSDPKHPNIVDIDIDYLTSNDSDICFQLLERYDALDETSDYKLTGFDRLVPFLIFGFLGVGVVLAFVGLFTVLSWAF
jgi:hypothetical protein